MSLPTVCYLYNSSMSSLSQRRGKNKRGGPKSSRVPVGDKLIDSAKQEWIIHSSIARGGFGEIYTASSSFESKQQSYVIKIEPSENGPLFCEKTVYIRIGKKEDIKEYMREKGLKSLGMPQFYGSGVHTSDGKKFRFLVMDRYGQDLWSIFLDSNRKLPAPTVFKITNQVLDVLEYIHSKGYVHADIKGANLLLGRLKGTENQVYLVDFGLAARYTNQYKADPRRAHNGTIEYTSRDGHEGIVTRRGDIEVLGFNILQWISSNLPWEGSKDLNDVQAKKEKFMKNYHLLFQSCFKTGTPPRALEKYFENLVKMDPLGEPNYNALRQYMKEGILKSGDISNKLDFSPAKSKKVKTERSPVPQKIRKVNQRSPARRAKSGSSKTSSANITIDLSDQSDEDEEDDDDDDFIEGTPEKKSPVKRSWKDCPSVVSCAELLLKDDRTIRRSKRNK